MPTKSLRILIADPVPDQALTIEKALNVLGYYRIAPLHTVQALLSVSDAQPDEFDVLFISQCMTFEAGLDPAQWRRDNPQFRHVLKYEDAVTFAAGMAETMQRIDPSG